ncbi:MAG TPA: lipocalin family protein [Bacteroidales bacterium]|nr:lipocalin family protein [Bacteroidales bacterium]
MQSKDTLKKIILVMGILSFFSCTTNKPLETVEKIDIEKYMGKWYEIATIPQRFQKGCNCVTAEYTLTDEGYVKVLNSCRKDSTNGSFKSIEGKAFISKKGNGAKLKVQFFWPFKAKYWIIGLADDYSWAVVGHPNREYLWILSRSPQIDENLYITIIEKLKTQDYDTGLLVKTDQNCP